MMEVEIDERSGFCAGVIRAICRAEEFLDDGGMQLYSLGSIVHNEAELQRLEAKGLSTLQMDEFLSMSNADGKSLLIRAHGEPPSTYEKARSLGFNVIDCTCPVVLQLQKRILKAHSALEGRGQLIIFGKVGHAEVLGLLGQVDGDAVVVVENAAMLKELMDSGKIRLDGAVELFSQTTKSPVEYAELGTLLAREMARRRKMDEKEFARTGELRIHDTICSQVATRHEMLGKFALSHDLLLFVSGRESSNGKVLYELCKSLNPNTFHICSPEDIKPSMLKGARKVGICGATSTPKWLLEAAADAVRKS